MFVKEVNNWIFQKKLKQESQGNFISIYVERALMKLVLCSWHLTDAFSFNLPKDATVEVSYSLHPRQGNQVVERESFIHGQTWPPYTHFMVLPYFSGHTSGRPWQVDTTTETTEIVLRISKSTRSSPKRRGQCVQYSQERECCEQQEVTIMKCKSLDLSRLLLGRWGIDGCVGPCAFVTEGLHSFNKYSWSCVRHWGCNSEHSRWNLCFTC